MRTESEPLKLYRVMVLEPDREIFAGHVKADTYEQAWKDAVARYKTTQLRLERREETPKEDKVNSLLQDLATEIEAKPRAKLRGTRTLAELEDGAYFVFDDDTKYERIYKLVSSDSDRGPMIVQVASTEGNRLRIEPNHKHRRAKYDNRVRPVQFEVEVI